MKMFKYFFLIFCLSASLYAANWNGSTREPESTKKIDGKVFKVFYVITSAEELAWFAAQVNGGASEINAVLANDIKFMDDISEISSISWTPIGKDSLTMFNGIFDGVGRTIYGLYSEQDKFAGLFGVMDKASMVKDVNLKNGKIQTKSDKSYAGGIVAFNRGTVSGCTNGSMVYAITSSAVYTSISSYSGGIVGYNTGTVTDCANNGAVSAVANATSSSNSVSPNSGGIVGKNAGIITGCTNRGTISASVTSTSSASTYAYSHSGGIVGDNTGSVFACTNRGKVFSTATGRYSSYMYRSCSGGIVGYNTGTIADCANSGAISAASTLADGVAASMSGGIVGFAVRFSNSKILNCFSVANSTKAGVSGTSYGTVTNCYYDSDVLPGRSIAAPDSGLHTSDMQSDRFAWVLNTTDGTAVHSGLWSRDSVGYPIYVDSIHKPIYKVVFDDDGVITNRYTNYKGLVSFPENPETPDGIMFSGWYTDDGVKVKATTIFSKDQTVHAVYIDASDIYFSIRFFNSDTTLLDSQSVQYGRTPSYAGTPTKASTAQFSYAFEGWHVEPTAVTEDFDYYAVYSETLRSYTVRFLDFDGTELQNSTYLYGATPGVSKVPARASTVAYDYAFSGWTPAIKAVTGDAVYTALYDSSKVLYTVTFMDGSSVFATVQVPYGEAAKAPGTPSREGYKFVGWNGSLSNVTGNMTVSALFEELVYREVVIDRGDDGMDTVKVEEDEWFTLPEAPEKPGHTFTGWYGPDGDYLGKAGDTVKVSADMRIEPRYEANLYRIAFVNGSDTLQSGEAAYGTLPSYSGSTPTKAFSAKFTYAFKGWEPAIDTVKEPATYTAIFDSTLIPQISSSSSSAASSSSGEKSSSSAASSGSSAKSSSSSAVKNSSSSSEPSDAIMSNLPTPTWSVTAAGRNFQIHAAPVGKSYALFDLQGKVLAKGRIESPEMTLSAPRAGSYIVRIGNHSVRVNAK